MTYILKVDEWILKTAQFISNKTEGWFGIDCFWLARLAFITLIATGIVANWYFPVIALGSLMLFAVSGVELRTRAKKINAAAKTMDAIRSILVFTTIYASLPKPEPRVICLIPLTIAFYFMSCRCRP